MLVEYGNVGAGIYSRRILALAVSPIIIIATACSGKAPDNPQSTSALSSNVTETTKNPLNDFTAATAAGKTLFTVNCASCHGDDGKGEGDYSASLPAKPSNLTANDVVSAPDGKIFLVVRNGKMRQGKITMAPARGVTDEQIWQMVSYVRALSGNHSENKKED
jgi:mono/diheme cytochrome c family protein